jgi:predicted nucleic acid binding AN1-type Zn finger protein
MKSLPKVLREIMYGLTLHEMDLETKKMRGHLDHLFMLIVFGDLVGLPLLPPYYAMRLLPYILRTIETWKRSLLRERDLTDFVSSDL